MKKFCLFICQAASARSQRSGLFLVFESKSATCYYLSNHTKVKASHQVPVQEHNKRTCWLVFYNQGNCEYQIFKSFVLTRRELNPGLPTAKHGRQQGIFVWPFFGLFLLIPLGRGLIELFFGLFSVTPSPG